jgi:pSer/pThr/pTyr-binding forkhead associated (FHA) protein
MAQCAACGASVGPGELVCPSCGASVTQPTASFEPVAAEQRAPEVAAEAVDGPVLIVRKGPQPGERFFVDCPKLTIGRDPESDIFLNDMTVSRTHAVVENVDGVCRVTDAASLNGTYVNGEIVDDAVLADGDVVQIGTFQMIFLSGS